LIFELCCDAIAVGRATGIAHDQVMSRSNSDEDSYCLLDGSDSANTAIDGLQRSGLPAAEVEALA